MAKIVLEGVDRNLDGSYELDLGRFSNDELRLIKRESGVRAGELEDAMRAGDNDLLVCFAHIALERAGRVVVPEVLWQSDAGSIRIDLQDEVDDALPPVQETEPVESEFAPTGSS